MRTTIIKCLLCILCYTIGYGQNDTIIIQNVNVIPMHQEVVWENQTVVIARSEERRVG